MGDAGAAEGECEALLERARQAEPGSPEPMQVRCQGEVGVVPGVTAMHASALLLACDYILNIYTSCLCLLHRPQGCLHCMQSCPGTRHRSFASCGAMACERLEQ